MIKKILTKNQTVEQTRTGKDMGKVDKSFAEIIAKTKDKYGLEKAKKIAGLVFWAMRRKGEL